MAVVERAEREVVVELGVPLGHCQYLRRGRVESGERTGLRWECLGWREVRGG